MIPAPADLPSVLDPQGLLHLGVALVVLTSAASVLLGLGHRRQAGLAHLLLAALLQGLGLLGYLAGPWPGHTPVLIPFSLLAGAGYGFWGLRIYSGHPPRMHGWGWLALGSWVLVAIAFHFMGFAWVRGLAAPTTLALLLLGISRELARLAREQGGNPPAQVCGALAAVLGLAALGSGMLNAYLPADSGVYSLQTRAWFFFGLLAAQQRFTLLLAQVQGQRVATRLDRLVATDPLTGLASARGFRANLDRAVGRSLRTGKPASILILDLDGLDGLLEEHGSALLSRVQEAFAGTMVRTLREADLPGRLEGCRFAALLHQTAPLEALLAAERLRAAWENVPLNLEGSPMRPTLSGGVASTRESIEGPEELLALAIHRAALARVGGGNNVEGEPL